ELAEAVESCVSGAYGAVGQNCIGVQRIFVERPIYNQFVERFAALSKEYTTGDKKLQSPKMRPLMSEDEAVRVEGSVAEAVANGATLLAGGKRQGAYYEATLLTKVPRHARIVKEEIFGPVVML